jgi:hypothetical protein
MGVKLCGKWGNVTFYMVFLATRKQFNTVGYFHSLDLFFVNAWQWQLGTTGNSNIPLLVGGCLLCWMGECSGIFFLLDFF